MSHSLYVELLVIRSYKLNQRAKNTCSESIIEKLLKPKDCKYLNLDQEKQKIMILRQTFCLNFQVDQWVIRVVCSLIKLMTEEKQC